LELNNKARIISGFSVLLLTMDMAMTLPVTACLPNELC